MRRIFTFSLLFIAVFVISVNLVHSQTMMSLPAHSSVYSGIYTRGYWFKAPCDFTMTGLRVAPDAGTGLQYIHVMKCSASFPVAYSSQSTSFSTLAYLSAGTNNSVLSVNISVKKGDQIGILGTVTGICNSYAATQIVTSTINGLNVNLNRFGYQGSIESGAAPSYWGEADSSSGQIGRIFMYYTVGQPSRVSSVMVIQPDTNSTPAGTKNKRIIGVKVNTSGTVANAKITQFSFDTAGTFNFSNITGTAKVYYTGRVDTFNTNKLFDSTSTKPSTAFTISGSQTLDTGTVYFWLTFDVNFNATINDYLDAKCTQVKWDSAGTTRTVTPLTTSPPGKIRITAPLKKLNTISFVQPSTDIVFRYSIDNPVLRIDLNVIGTAGTLPLNQIKITANNTSNNDVSNVKLYHTTTTTFSNANQIGTTKTLSSGTVDFSSLNFSLPTGNSYIWVTYDIPGSAVLFNSVDAYIAANQINIAGKSYPSTNQNPAGDRKIYTNFQYDAGISAIISPSAPFCDTFQTIKVSLRNYGTTTLTSDTIRWTVNGVTQPYYVWAGSLTTGNSAVITLGTYKFIRGNSYSIKVFPSYFNGQYNDYYLPNDTVTISNFVFYPVPVANFNINDTFQCLKGNKFVFSNTSSILSGTYTSKWNFGDNMTSSTTSPSHSYQTLNTYPVKLIVTSAYGCPDSISKYVYLKPNQTTNFAINDTSICLKGNSFSFTNQTSFSSGTFTNFWKFSDNTTSTSSNPNHTYSNAGTFVVKLITTTNTGCIDSISKTVHVNVHPAAALVIKNDTFDCFKTNNFKFDNNTSISAGTFTNYWNFGDNTTSTSLSPNKTYSSTGTFTVKYIATSNFGCKDSITKKVIIYPNPVTGFTINDSDQCTNLNNFSFSNSSSIASGTFSNTWYFGDMTGASNSSPSKIYLTSGIYNVKLVITSGFGCKDSLIKKVYVRPVPVTAFSINDSNQCLRTNSVHFNNITSISSGSFTNWWNFGNNTFSTLLTPTIKYSAEDTYTVKLVTTSNYGCKDSISRKVYVNPHPQTSFLVNDSTQCIKDNNFVFTNSTSINKGSFSNHWDFGDFNYSTSTNPSYIYSSEGNFKVKLITTSNAGCKDTFQKSVYINPNPYAYFTAGVSTQCLRSNIFIMDNHSSVSSGKISQYIWNFGDGDTSSFKSPKHSYLKTGKFNINLKVISDNGCSDTLSRKIEVVPQPVAGIAVNDTALCFKNHVFQLNDNSKTSTGTITNYYWNLGDGKTSSQKDITHTYKITKSFKITHIVTSSNGCTDTTYKTVYIYPMPTASFIVDDTNQCLFGNLFKFENNSSGSDKLNYQWAFGDGNSSILKEPSLNYSKSGDYNIRLITRTENNCSDTAYQQVIVRANPIVKLGNDTTLLHNQSITLNAGNGFDKYIWSNGDTNQTIKLDSTIIGLNNPTMFWVNVLSKGCSGNDSIIVTFTWNNSINGKNNFTSLLAYPNPVSDYLNLVFDQKVVDFNITLSDINGKIVRKEIINDISNFRLDMRELSEGIYFIQLNDGKFLKVVKF